MGSHEFDSVAMSLQVPRLLVQCFLLSITKSSLWRKKKTYPELKTEKVATGYKIPTSKEPKKRKNRVRSKAGFFCLMVIL